MRDLLFRPMFTPVDWFATTLACALMLNGHWLASIPVMLLGAGAYAYGRRWMRTQPAIRMVRGRR